MTKESDRDRVTFTFDAPGQPPGYRVGYVTAISSEEDGDPIEVEGKAYLDVDFSFTSPNTRGRLDPSVPTRTAPRLPEVREIVLARNVGGSVRFGIGLVARTPFRVTPLTAPARIVLDIRHPSAR